MENLAPDEAAKALGVEVSTIYSWANRRKIPFVNVGAALRFRPSALQDWLRQREYLPPAEGAERVKSNGINVGPPVFLFAIFFDRMYSMTTFGYSSLVFAARLL